MERLVVYYRYVDAKSEAHSYVWVIAFVCIAALFIPMLWLMVAVAVLVVLPIQYSEHKKQQKAFHDNVPALVIDGNTLEYKGKSIDLSQMSRAIFHPDTDYDGNILIFREGKTRPVIEIYTDNMQIDRDELLSLIKSRIKQTP